MSILRDLLLVPKPKPRRDAEEECVAWYAFYTDLLNRLDTMESKMNEQYPKLDKAFLSKVSCAAKTVYKERGNCDGSQYLDPNEINTRAYIEGYLSVLSGQGYMVVRKPTK